MSSSREGVLLRGYTAAQARPLSEAVAPQPFPEERRTTIRRAADMPVPTNRPSFRLGDVYAEELERLRARAHAEGPEAELAALPASVTVVADDTIERAGAVAETGSRRIDAQLSAALERVQAVLTS